MPEEISNSDDEAILGGVGPEKIKKLDLSLQDLDSLLALVTALYPIPPKSNPVQSHPTYSTVVLHSSVDDEIMHWQRV